MKARDVFAAASARRNLIGLACLCVLGLLAFAGIGAPAALAAAPEITAGPTAENVRYTTAHLTAELDPKDHETSFHFEWVTQAQFEAEGFAAAENNFQMTGFGSYPENVGPLRVEAELGGLAPSTTYHLRFVAENVEAERVEAVAASTFQTEAVARPSVGIDPVVTFGATTATFSGGVDPNSPEPEGSTDAAEQEAFRSSWHFECNPSCGAPSGAVVEADDSAHPVSAEATGLQPHTEYAVKLIAENAGGREETTEVTFTSEPAAPTITQNSVEDVTETTATLKVQVVPGGAPTTVRFEYTTQAQFEASGFAGAAITPESASLGEDNSEHPAEASLTSLQPGTGYRYRVVATNSVESLASTDRSFHTLASEAEQVDTCPNAALRAEQHSAFLPNCRAYELVSPADKGGGSVSPDSSRTRAAQELSPGEPMALQFSSLTGFSDTRGGGVATDYLAERVGTAGSNGWSTHSITPEQDPMPITTAANADPAYEGDFSPDLSEGIFRAFSPVTTEDPMVAHVENLYLRNDLRTSGPGSYRLLTSCPGCTAPLGVNGFEPGAQFPRLVGASADFDHVVFESHYGLTSDAPECSTDPSVVCSNRVYEWDHGTVRSVDILPDGSTSASAVGGGGRGARGGSHLGIDSYVFNAVSADGSRVFFTDQATGVLYMRLNHTTTVPLTAPERTDCASHEPCIGEIEATPPAGGEFRYASEDGSKVFFLSQAQLTDSSEEGTMLYMYDTTKPASDPHNLTVVSVDNEPADGNEASVLGMLGGSRDGNWVYFLSRNQLVPGGPLDVFDEASGVGSAGGIFLWHDGTIHYLGRVSGLVAFGNPVANNVPGLLGDQYPDRARVSPDGTHLLVELRLDPERGIGGYDQPPCPQEGSEPIDACREIYLYSADTDTFTCVSCNPSGVAATSDARMSIGDGQTDGIGSATNTEYLNHPMTTDGSRVFFSSADPLVPRDFNGASDAYEYDVTTGKLHLLSTGEDPRPSYFLDASADGKDVFIRTAQRLVGWDTDSSQDIYDVRVGGGFPEPIAAAPPCAADECQGRLGEPPASQVPGSSSYVGPGTRRAHGPKHRHRAHKRRRRCVKRKPKQNRRCANTRGAKANYGGSK